MKRLLVAIIALATAVGCTVSLSGRMSVLQKDVPAPAPSPSPSPAVEEVK